MKRMKGGSINMVDLDFEYKIWKNRLVLFENEIEILKNRNDEIKTLPGFAPLNSVELMVLDEHLDQLQNLLNLINGQENEFKFRITSYNVCYTKLLRGFPADRLHGTRLRAWPSPCLPCGAHES